MGPSDPRSRAKGQDHISSSASGLKPIHIPQCPASQHQKPLMGPTELNKNSRLALHTNVGRASTLWDSRDCSEPSGLMLAKN